MQNITIGIVSTSALPYNDVCAIEGLHESKFCPEPGYDVEVLGQILKKAKIEYNLVSVYDDNTEYTNSTWQGIFAMVYNGTIQVAASTFVRTSLRTQFFDLTVPVAFEDIVFIFKKVDDSFESHIQALIKPLSNNLWISFGICFATIAILWLFRQWICGYGINLWEYCLIMLGRTEYNQCRGSRRFKISTKLVFGSVTILIALFQVLYEGALLIKLLHSESPVLFSSVTGLIRLLNSGRIMVVTEDDSWAFFEKLKTETVQKEIMDLKTAIFKNGNLLKVETYEKVVDYVKMGKYVHPTLYSEAAYTVGKHCDLTFMKLDNIYYDLRFMFQKNSVYLSNINKIISESWPLLGYFDNKYKKVMKREFKCGLKTITATRRRLDIFDISGIVILFSFGLTIALTIFVFEKCKTFLSRGNNL